MAGNSNTMCESHSPQGRGPHPEEPRSGVSKEGEGAAREAQIIFAHPLNHRSWPIEMRASCGVTGAVYLNLKEINIRSQELRLMGAGEAPVGNPAAYETPDSIFLPAFLPAAPRR